MDVGISTTRSKLQIKKLNAGDGCVGRFWELLGQQ